MYKIVKVLQKYHTITQKDSKVAITINYRNITIDSPELSF